jgi:energy-converting hydrogenase Eha subunit A
MVVVEGVALAVDGAVVAVVMSLPPIRRSPSTTSFRLSESNVNACLSMGVAVITKSLGVAALSKYTVCAPAVRTRAVSSEAKEFVILAVGAPDRPDTV